MGKTTQHFWENGAPAGYSVADDDSGDTLKHYDISGKLLGHSTKDASLPGRFNYYDSKGALLGWSEKWIESFGSIRFFDSLGLMIPPRIWKRDSWFFLYYSDMLTAQSPEISYRASGEDDYPHFCTYCGTPLSYGAHFCSGCGRRVDGAPVGENRSAPKYLKKGVRIKPLGSDEYILFTPGDDGSLVSSKMPGRSYPAELLTFHDDVMYDGISLEAPVNGVVFREDENFTDGYEALILISPVYERCIDSLLRDISAAAAPLTVKLILSVKCEGTK